MTSTPTHLLDQTITIQRSTVTQDAMGGPSVSWSNEYTGVRARVQPQSGSESFRAGGKRSQQSFQIFVAGSQDVLNTDRIVWNSKTLKIISPPKDPQGAGVLLRIDCEEIEP